MKRCVLWSVGALVVAVAAGWAYHQWNPAATGVPAAAPVVHLLTASPPTRDEDYVGSESCGACHSGIWRRYRESSMGRSLAAPLEAVPQIERYSSSEFSPDGPRRYRVEREGDGVRHHESLVDADGTVVYDQSLPVAFEVGSGNRGRSYLFEHDDMLFSSQIAWFSARQEWGLAPGYLPDAHPRFERRVTEGCIACHAGRAAVNRDAPDKLGKPALIEGRIGCERCHGPGARHVAAHEAAQDRVLTDEMIVHPARLDSARQVSICAQCHLYGEARIMRTGQKAGDFQPGRLLEENRIVFVAKSSGSDQSRRQSLSQTEQMLASACYRGSEGRLGCTSCHDPHGSPAPQDRSAFYRAKCLACHEVHGCGLSSEDRLAREVNDSCAACHMPSTLHVVNILHASFVDHRIMRQVSSTPENAPGLPQTAGDLEIFDRAERRVPQMEIDRARAFLLVGGGEFVRPTPAGARQAEELLRPVLAAQPGDIDTLEMLGAACLRQGKGADAERYWLQALELDPDRESVLRNLGTYYYDRRAMKSACDYLQRFLMVNPCYGFMHAKYAGALGALGDWHKCVAAAERALELNPTLASAHELLAFAWARLGNTIRSQRHREMFEIMQRLLPRGSADE